MNSDADEALAKWDAKVSEVLAHSHFLFFYFADVTFECTINCSITKQLYIAIESGLLGISLKE